MPTYERPTIFDYATENQQENGTVEQNQKEPLGENEPKETNKQKRKIYHCTILPTHQRGQ